MLNHTAGVDAVLSACRTAELRTVITSRRFVELAKLDALAERAGRRRSRSSGSRICARRSACVDKLYGAGRAAFRRLRGIAGLGIAAERPGGDPVHLGLGGRAERGRAEPRQPARQPAPARGADRFQPGRPSCSTRCRCSTASG